MITFEQLTVEQITEICNGCGGKGSVVVPPHALFFDNECDKHDFGYYVGGDEDDRLSHDNDLLIAMKKACTVLKWYNKLRYYPWCYAYYYGVRLMGGKYFFYTSVKRWPELS